MEGHERIDLGKLGEDAACKYLEDKGYQIIERNFRHHHYAEIDIIAGKGPVISFIEVKTRISEKYGLPEEAVTRGKQKKIFRCAEYFLLKAGLLKNPPPLSFDVIAITLQGKKIVRLEHFKQCFI